MNVSYSCNEAYLHHTGISILSLLEKNKHISEITIYFIAKDIEDSSISLISKLVEKYKRRLVIISFYDLCFDLNIKSTGRHIETIYTKLFFSRIDSIDKMLYIDSDTIINESLQELWDIDLEDNYVAGVETYTMSLKNRLSLDRDDRFINDGVVLINVSQFRKQNIIQEVKKCIADYDGDPPLLSEGVINKVCRNKIKVLHPKYNLMSGLIEFKGNRFENLNEYYSKDILDEARKSPVIIHYLAAFYNRPWDINCTHPMKNIYLYYKSQSFWKDIPLENRKLSFRLRVIRLIYKIFPHDFPDLIQHFKNNILSIRR